MYAPIAAEIIRRETIRAARSEVRPRPPSRPIAVRRRLAIVLRRYADRLAPEV